MLFCFGGNGSATSVDVEEHLYRLAKEMGITLVTSSQVSHIKSSLKDLVLLYSPKKLVLLGSFPLMNQNLYLVLQHLALIPFHSVELRLIDSEGNGELRSIKEFDLTYKTMGV